MKTYEVTVDDFKTMWKLNGELHRDDGPAIECVNGDKAYYINGKHHRIDGPSVVHLNGGREYWVDGNLVLV